MATPKTVKKKTAKSKSSPSLRTKPAANPKAAPAKKQPTAKSVPRTKSAAKPKSIPRSQPAAKPKKATPRSKPSSAREKLAVIRPSGEPENNFFELVHELARQVPKGRVTSYGAIAKALGTGRSARMVGWAMNACHLSKRPVPAHRVVNSAGLLTGRHHFKPPEKMQQLLEKEGTKVVNNKVVDFKTKFWDPSAEF